jgi:MYXO-CTERM domain-containing protein
VLLSAPDAGAQPETPGPYKVGVWKDPPGTPVPCPEGIFYPEDAPCPGAPVALVHGGGESGAYKLKMAELVASRGLVAVVPSFPSLLISPSAEDGAAVNELLEWTVAQGNDPGSPLYQKIDPGKLGVAGHSNGGIVFHAAASNPKIQAIVGWDAVAGLAAASGFHGPSLHLLAEGQHCSGGSSQGYDGAPAPKARAVVTSGSHCDFNDPESPFCVTFCGTPPWDAQAAKTIERYSVAWLVCLLGHDPSMQAFVGFTGALEGLSSAKQVGEIACQPACGAGGSGASGATGATTATGAGPAGAGGGGTAGVGAGGGGGGPGATSDDEGDAGCGCRLVAHPPRGRLALGVLALGAAALRRRRRRCPPGVTPG